MKKIPRITALALALILAVLFALGASADDASRVFGPQSGGDAAGGAARGGEKGGERTDLPAFAAADKTPFDVDAKSAVLIDLATGEVLYAKNANEALPPASVTKIMTLLLTKLNFH